MTDLHHVLPDFSTKTFTHLLPSLEKAHVTVSDLITLEPIDVARRALVPVAELQRLASDIVRALHADTLGPRQYATSNENKDAPETSRSVISEKQECKTWRTVQILDEALDAALGGGLPKGYVVEVTGER